MRRFPHYGWSPLATDDAKPDAKSNGDAKSKKSSLVETIKAWAPAIIAVIVIRVFVFEPFKIPSASMVPTLLIGDHVVVTKFSYGLWLPFLDKEVIDFGDPERGDIIVFEYPRNPSQAYIKRVVAIPGDVVSVSDNRITVNGELQTVQAHPDGATYEFQNERCGTVKHNHWLETVGEVQHEMLTSPMGARLSHRDPTPIPPGEVFVMGDNRDNSEDSRSWGTVRFDQIKGKAQLVWLSVQPRNCGETNLLRQDRFFHSLYADDE